METEPRTDVEGKGGASGSAGPPSKLDMPKVPDSLLLVILLFPGFISERVARYLTTFPKQTDVELIASALSFTLFNLFLAWSALWVCRYVIFIWEKSDGDAPSFLRGPRTLVVPYVAVLLVVSVLAGYVWAWVEERNLVFDSLDTTRQSRSDTWTTVFARNAHRSSESEDAFLARVQNTCLKDRASRPRPFLVPNEPRHVHVVLTSGEAFQGKPLAYTDNETDRWVYLQTTQTSRFVRREPPPSAPKDSSSGRQPEKEKGTAPEAPWTAECVEGPFGVLINASQIQSIEVLQGQQPDAGKPGQLLRGRAYTCDEIRKAVDAGATLSVPTDPVGCAARVPLSLLRKD